MTAVRTRRTRRVVVAWFATLMAAVATMFVVSPEAMRAAAAAATGGKADFSVSISPNEQSAQVGKSAAYTVTVTAVNGFTGTLSLSASDLPGGSTASWSSSSLSLGTSGSILSTTLTIATSRSTPLATYTFKVPGTSGKLVRSTSAKLTVEKTPGSLSLSMSPTSANVAAGSTTSYTVGLNRTGSATEDKVVLALSGLPADFAWIFTPNDTTATSSTLSVSVPSSAKATTHDMTISGSVNGAVVATASASLTVLFDGKGFVISGNATVQLAPGVTAPLDLLLSNPNNRALSITNLSAVAATGSDTCTVDNYAVKQFSGSYPISLSAGAQNKKLSELLAAAGVPTKDITGQLPALQMLNLNRNQDACRSPAFSTIKVSYSGSATGE